jgi:hypothetical protein
VKGQTYTLLPTLLSRRSGSAPCNTVCSPVIPSSSPVPRHAGVQFSPPLGLSRSSLSVQLGHAPGRVSPVHRSHHQLRYHQVALPHGYGTDRNGKGMCPEEVGMDCQGRTGLLVDRTETETERNEILPILVRLQDGAPTTDCNATWEYFAFNRDGESIQSINQHRPSARPPPWSRNATHLRKLN